MTTAASPPAVQQPAWPDAVALARVRQELARRPALVEPADAEALRLRLADAAAGRAFVLQAGACAETFADATAEGTRSLVRLLLQMALVLTWGAQVPVVKVGRLAGQFGKPRSADSETVDGVVLPVYRGDAVNDLRADPAARTPDPDRLLRAYDASRTVLDALAATAHDGEASLEQVHAWTADFAEGHPAARRYAHVADEVDAALAFMRAIGVDVGDAGGPASRVDAWTSHEALLLDYERPLTREVDGRRWATSGHLVWVGERTRDPEGAHVAWAASVANPVGVKLGPSARPDDVLRLADALDPDGVPGRLVLVPRMGAAHVREVLPPLVEAVREAGRPALWVCDPMHGNTRTTSDGRKTRHLADVVDEVDGFFAVHAAAGTWPGGLHVELVGSDVTECLGGGADLTELDLPQRYETACDPRLNAAQSLELAFEAASLLRETRASRRSRRAEDGRRG